MPTALDVVDVAGLIAGASEGAGLGNQFLATIRECNALIQVVRCFEDGDIHHVDGTVDPIRDVDTINLELVLADLSMVEKKRGKRGKGAGSAEAALLDKLMEHLDEGLWTRTLELTPREQDTLRGLQLPLLTGKPLVYAANVSEDDLARGNEMVDQVREHAAKSGDGVVVVSAQTEFELCGLDAGDRADMLEALGAEEESCGLHALVRAAYEQLELLTFYTTGETESRAWTVRRGACAPAAAGQIHSDIEAGFIKAETVSYADLVTSGSTKAAREAGLLRAEGKDYVVADGDVFNFKFRG